MSYSDKLVSISYLKVLPQALKFIIISIYIIWKHLKLIKTSHRYASTVDKKSVKFWYMKADYDDSADHCDYCSICLSEYEEHDELRQVVECGHSFHGHCLDRWLKEAVAGVGATCPLCRGLVVPEAIVSAYRRVQIEQEKIDGIEEELALILFKVLPAGTCNGFAF